MKRSIHILLSLLLFLGCTAEEPPVKTYLVLEGWIDSGGHPMILLSETLPAGNRLIRRSEVIGNIAKWARVSVSDGDEEVILTGTLDNRYFPPYVYTSERITGVPGKTYTVDVKYKDYHATARTTIPEPVPLDTIYSSQLLDTLYRVMCGFTDPPEKGNYYKFFTMTEGVDERYQPSVMAMASDEVFEGYTEIPLWSTQRLLNPLYRPDMIKGNTVQIKFCTMDKGTFRFWENYEVTLATNANAMYYFEADMGANVEGALGYWAGYGVNEYTYTIE